jgi:hypothetical protein
MPPRLRGFQRSPGRRSERGMVRARRAGSRAGPEIARHPG